MGLWSAVGMVSPSLSTKGGGRRASCFACLPSPKGTPKVSPKGTPKVSPKGTPKVSPKGKGGGLYLIYRRIPRDYT